VKPFDSDPGERYSLSVMTVPTPENLEVELYVTGSDGWECATVTTTDSRGAARFPTQGDPCDHQVVDSRIPGAAADTVETIRIVLPSLDWAGEVTFVF
jgi:hypothetical protein